LVQLISDKLKSLKVPLISILLEESHVFSQTFQLLNRLRHFDQDGFLPMLPIFEITKRLLLEVAIDE
jgi:hypothetical protein